MSRNMHNRLRAFPVACIALSCLAVSACSGVKQQLGLERSTPDEFAVVRQAPLTIPPDYSLRPPNPGAPRPQDQASVEQAQETVFGGGDTTDTAGGQTHGDDQAFLAKAGADNAQPHIRQMVETDYAKMKPASKTAVQKLGLAKSSTVPASVVDAQKESDRLKQAQQQDRPITTGKTPTVQQ